MFVNRNFVTVAGLVFLFSLPSGQKSVHAKESSLPDADRPVLESRFAREPLITIYSHGGYRGLTRQAFEELVLQRADQSQTVHYGELHGNKAAELLVMSLLKKHRKQGFAYFAMELDTHEQPLIDDFLLGRIDEERLEKRLDEISAHVRSTGGGHYDIKGALPLLCAAHSYGYKIVLFDERPIGLTAPGDTSYADCGEPRNRAEFENLGRFIFDKDPDARVVVLSGLDHIDERPNYTFNCGKTDQKKLGYFLEEYTGGRNLSVNLGSEVYRKIFKDFVRVRKPGIFPAQVDLEFSIK